MCKLDDRITSRKKQLEARRLVIETCEALGGVDTRGVKVKASTLLGVNSGIITWFTIEEYKGMSKAETEHLRWTHITLTGLLMERIKWAHSRATGSMKLNAETETEVDEAMLLAKKLEIQLGKVRKLVSKKM